LIVFFRESLRNLKRKRNQ